MEITNIFQALGATLESATQHFASRHSAALAKAIFPFVSGGLLCWIMFMGYQTMIGKLQEPFINLVQRSAAVVFLSAIAFGPSIYQVEILNDFDTLQSLMVSAVAGEQTNPYRAADVTLEKGFELASQFSKETTVWGAEAFYGWMAGSFIIYGGTVVLATMAAGSIMVAKASLAVVLAFGQLAIACAIFPATKKFFDAFISTALNRVMHIVVVTMVMGFALDLFTIVASGYDADTSSPLAFAWQLLIAVIVAGMLIFSAGTLASELAGGVALAVSNPITAAARMATKPFSSATRYLTGKSSRTNAKTGRPEYASRFSHIARGNTFANPAYRQKAGANMKSGWGAAEGGSTKSYSNRKSTADRLKEMAKRVDKG